MSDFSFYQKGVFDKKRRLALYFSNSDSSFRNNTILIVISKVNNGLSTMFLPPNLALGAGGLVALASSYEILAVE